MLADGVEPLLLMTIDRARGYLRVAVIAGVLVVGVFVVRRYDDSIHRFIQTHAFWGLFLYITLNVIDAVIAPGITLPLIPIAVRVWGRAPAALATTTGWTLGSLLAFLIARRWGAPLVRRLTSLERIRALRRYIPQNLFWSIVVVRMVLPMDVISYVLGLFSGIGWRSYVAATALGLTPSAFLFAYLGKLPHGYELIALGIGAMAIVGGVLVARRQPRS